MFACMHLRTYLAGVGVTPSDVLVGPGAVEVVPLGISPGSVVWSSVLGVEDVVPSSEMVGPVSLGDVSLGVVLLGGVPLGSVPTVGVSGCTSENGLAGTYVQTQRYGT